MPNNIDEQVVKLSVDSKSLDRDTKHAINKLDELKTALQFKGVEKGFDNITKAAEQVNLSPIEKGVQAVSNQFDAMATIGTAALFRLTNQAIDAGERMIKSLTIDNVVSGWDKFANKTAAVQTIMAATSKQFDDTGKQMKFVEEQLESLNWFTDETSYKFVDMVNNIGKFTSNSIALDASVEAMQGISTWAARSGANVNEAGRAMYNLSQALATGAVKLIDWKSIENANMATAEFKETAIETAVALGTLTKVGENAYATLSGKNVSVSNFNENLSEAWFTSDVLLATLKKYGSYATELYKFVEATEEVGASTASLINIIDDYAEGNLDMAQAMQITGMSAQELTPWLEKLSSEEMKLGRESFKAAQETKTFQESIDYVKEAVGSGWMRTFESVFGNYEEAKEFWTNVTEYMYDFFVASGDARNGLLALWKEAGGRDTFIDGIYALLDAITSVKDAIGDGIREVFPPATVDTLLNVTDGFRVLIDILTPTDLALNSIRQTVSFLANILRSVVRVVKTVTSALLPIADLIDKLAGTIVYLIGNMMELAGISLNNLFNDKNLNSVYIVINGIAKLIDEIGTQGLVAVVNLANKLFGFLRGIFDNIKSNGGGIQGIFKGIAQSIQEFFQSFTDGNATVSGFFDGIASNAKKLLKNVVDIVTSIISAITGVEVGEVDTTGIGSFFKSIVEMLDNLGITGLVSVAVGSIKTLTTAFSELLSTVDVSESSLKSIIDTILSELKDLYEYIKNGFSQLTFKDIKDIALVIFLGELVFGLRDLLKGLTTTVKGVGGTFSALTNVVKSFGKENAVDKLESILKVSKFAQMAIAIGVLVAGLTKLAQLDRQQLIDATSAVVLTVGSLILAMKMMEKLPKRTSPLVSIGGGDTANSFIALAAGIGIISLAVSQIAKISPDDLMKSEIVIATLGLLMIGLNRLFTTIGGSNMAGSYASLLLLALSIEAMTIPVMTLAAIDEGKVTQGVTAVTVLMTSLGLFAMMIQKTKWNTLLAAAPSVIALSTAIMILVGAIATISKISESGNLLSSVAALEAMMITLGGVMAAIGKFGKGGSGAILSASVGFIALAGAITIITAACKQLETVQWESIGKAGAILAGLMLAVLGGGAIAGIPLVAAGLMTLVATLNAVSTAMISFGAAAALFGVGVALIAGGIALVTGAIVGLGLVGKMFGEEFPSYVNTAMDGVQVAFYRLLEIIAGARTLMLNASLAFFGAIIEALNYFVPDILNGVMLLATGILNIIGDLGPPLIEALIKVIDALTEGVPKLLKALGNFTLALGKGLGQLLNDMLVGAIWFAVNSLFGENLGNKIMEALWPGINDRVNEIGDKTADSIENQGEKIESSAQTAGEATARGIKTGMENGLDDVYNAGAATGEAAIDGLKDGTGDPITPNGPISEPASEVGEAVIRGLNQGMENGQSDVAATAEGTGNVLIDTLDNTLDLGLTDIYNKLKNRVKSMKDMVSDAGNTESDKSTEPDNSEKEYEDAGEKNAEAYNKSLNSGISGGRSRGSGGTTKAVKSKAEEISDKFKDALEKIADDEEIADLMYKLWNAQNPQAAEMEKAAEEIEYQTAKVHYQLLKTEIAEKKYMETLQAMGATASETHDRYAEMLKEQTSLLELQNKVAELQNGSTQTSEEAIESFQKMSDLISKWDVDWLRELGFSNEEIGKAAAQQAGYTIPNAIEEKKQEVNSYIYDSATSGVEAYTSAITDGITQATPSVIDTFKSIPEQANTSMQDQTLSFQETGYSFVDAMGTGASTGEENFTTSINTTINSAIQQLSTEEAIQPWVTLGINLIDGLIVGVESKSGEFSAKVQQIVNEALAAAQAAAGVASPSTETMWMGEMLDQGLIVGMMNGLPEVTDAAMTIAQQALEAAMSQLGIASPSRAAYFIGRFFDEGLANGITDYSREVTNASQAMLNQMMKDADLYMSEVVQQAVGLMGYDKNKIPVEFVFESNWAHAKGDLSEIERMFYSLQMASKAVEQAYLEKYDDTFDEYIQKNTDPAMMAHMARRWYDEYGAGTKEYQEAWDKFLEPYQKRWQQLVDESANRIGTAEKQLEATQNWIHSQLADPNKQSFGEAKFQFTQNVYAPRQLNTVEIYRMTNNALSKYARKVPAKVYPEGGELDIR